jgi:hypothetical protein
MKTKFEVLGIKVDTVFINFIEGNFKDVNFLIDLSKISVEDKSNESLLNFDVSVDEENDIIKKFGMDNFTNDVGQLLLDMIEDGMVKEEQKEVQKNDS